MYILETSQLDMRKIADSGQVFRFNKMGDRNYELIAGDKLLYIEDISETDSSFSDIRKYKFSSSEKEYEEYWKHYFDMEVDYSVYNKNVPEDDEFLNKAIKYSKGMKILNQDKWEMLVSFIISQRKSIPAIKTSVEKLCNLFGSEIADGKYAFPSAQQLAEADYNDLEKCSMGYRTAYVYEAARRVSSGEMDIYSFDKLDDENLLAALMEFKGVGQKVANCVSLFAYHRISAFPVDVWIARILKEHYNGSFPLNLYEGYAGIMQQYIFFYGREMANIKLK